MPWPLDKEKNHEGVLSAKNENEKDDNDVNLSNNSKKQVKYCIREQMLHKSYREPSIYSLQLLKVGLYQ